MIAAINFLTSSSKVKIVNLLRTPKTPDDIAKILKITRQGVDKQLRELMRYGIVERRWFIGYNRPMIEYFCTEFGIKFYRDLDEVGTKLKESGRISLNEKLKSLDNELLDGSLTLEKYKEEKKLVESSMEWFS